MRLFRGRHKQRACVVGLDGVPIGLLSRLAASGVMPRAAEIIRGGRLVKMRAALPPVSSVSWSSFMTGANPAEHGIFGFTDVAPESYELRFPLFSDLAVPTLWDRLGEAGLRCAVINQPATYPARQMPGVLISGFVAPNFEKSVWPKQHLPELRRMGYRVDVEADVAQVGNLRDPDHFLDDLLVCLEARQRAVQHFWDLEEWDYFEAVVTETDRLHHFLWNAVQEGDNARHGRSMDCYRAIDALVGDVWERFARRQSAAREGEGFFLLSDHGFWGVRQEVCLNAWLKENGYLSYRKEAPASVADIAPGTRAFCLDPGRIYINRRGRFAQGCVEEAEAPALAQEIAAGLGELSFERQAVMQRVFSRDEIYHGSRVNLGPELVAVGNPGFDLKGTTKSKGVFTAPRFQGMHTWDDAFVWSALPIPDDPEIGDLAAIIERWVLG
jgi:predicted AlkP superfamily phosphohydrolase/phosphomutase